MSLEYVAEPDAILGWHFLADDRRLAHSVPPVTVQAGATYTVDGDLVLCERGLHGSVRAIDALEYAPGAVVCRTAHWGAVVHGTDKLCSQYRRVLWLADATTLLHTFACDVAEEALHAVRESDARSWAAIAAKRRWLRGEITLARLAAARDAARAAAWDAAWDAARAAARAAAWDAAWDRQNELLELRLQELPEAVRAL